MYRGECNITHGGSKTRLYRIWKQMRIRCRCETNPTYRYYGMRGIDICNEWEDFAVFREWALNNGYTDELSIDRIDADGNYEPANCRWVTRGENSRRAHAKYYTHNGVTLTHKEWAELIGISPSTLTQRIQRHGVESSLSVEKNGRFDTASVDVAMGGQR